MRQVLSKLNHSFSSVYSAITLVIIFVLYLVIGAVVDYLYGPKISNSLIFNGPFFIFLLSLVTLSLVVSFLKKFPIRTRLLGIHLTHIGLITICVSTIVSTFTSVKGHIELLEKSEVKTAMLDQYQAQLRERSSGKTLYIDLNFSVRPQGLNLDFGPVYLISYLPYSEKFHANFKSTGDNSAVVLKESRYLSGVNSELIYLSSSRLDHPTSIKDGNLEIVLFNQSMLNCLENLSNVNPACSVYTRRKSISLLKKEYCLTNKYALKEDGFYSLGNECKMQKVKLEVVGDSYKYRLNNFLEDTGLKLEYRYSSNFKKHDSDILKFYEKGNTQKIYQMKLGETREIIDSEGRFYDLKFHNKEFKLPFDIRLDKISKQNNESSYELSISDQKYILNSKNSKANISGWLISLDPLSPHTPKKVKLNVSFDPTRIFKVMGLVIFGFSLVVLGFQRRIS
ncbi:MULTISPECIES: hypothetical protein [Pseudomonadati]|uniref:hypothetical protein n=1 Tax=unclassified Halobacteriovorax TaxID=2639665 RepID=UPI00399A4A70